MRGDLHEMAYLSVRRGAANRNGVAHMGLHLQRGIQSNRLCTQSYSCIFYFIIITFCSGIQILFRVSLTLLLGRRREIEDTEDIITLANLLQDMVNAPEVSDCHTFIESIFKVPGSLKRIELEQMRMAAAKIIHNR